MFNLPASVQDSGVITAAKVSADLLQRQRGQLPGQIHADLARQKDVLVAVARLQLARINLEVSADLRGDTFHGGAYRLDLDKKMGRDVLEVERLASDLVKRCQLTDSALQLPTATGQGSMLSGVEKKTL